MNTSLRKRIFAKIMMLAESANRRLYDRYKHSLLSNISGLVLEIGPGTGINFNFLPGDITWMGIETNPAFHRLLLEAAKGGGIAATLLPGDAGHIPTPDNTFDVVFFTLLLCSVEDPAAAVAEMKRVLKPGGRLIFIEHVAARKSSGLRLIQEIVNPVNRIIADGCNCNRETWTIIEHSGFSRVDVQHLRVKGALPFHAPHIMGSAVK